MVSSTNGDLAQSKTPAPIVFLAETRAGVATISPTIITAVSHRFYGTDLGHAQGKPLMPPRSATPTTDRRPTKPHKPVEAMRSTIEICRDSETAPKRSQPPLSTKDRRARQVERLALVEVGVRHSPVSSMRFCLRKPINVERDVEYQVRDGGNKFSFGNLFLCRSVFCVYCRSLRGSKTGDTLRKGLLQAKQDGMSAGMLTLTLATDTMPISWQRIYLSKAFKLLQRRIAYRAKKYNKGSKVYFSWSYDVMFRKSDLTPHLHLHLICLSNSNPDVFDGIDFNDLWLKCLVSAGYLGATHRRSAYFEPVNMESDVSTYIFKVSQEINAKETKTSKYSYSFYELVKGIYNDTLGNEAIYQYRSIIEAFRGSRYQNVGIMVGKLARKYDEINEEQESTEHDAGAVKTVGISWLSHSILVKMDYALPCVADALMRDFDKYALIMKATDDAANYMLEFDYGSFEEVVFMWYKALASF